jgi:hypothetical protein
MGSASVVAGMARLSLPYGPQRWLSAMGCCRRAIALLHAILTLAVRCVEGSHCLSRIVRDRAPHVPASVDERPPMRLLPCVRVHLHAVKEPQYTFRLLLSTAHRGCSFHIGAED